MHAEATGKRLKQATEVRQAGADFVGGEELIEEIWEAINE